MTVDCPSCNRELKITRPEPGQHKHTCPGCRRTFFVTVPDDSDGDVLVQPLAARGGQHPTPKPMKAAKPAKAADVEDDPHQTTVRGADADPLRTSAAITDVDDDDWDVKAPDEDANADAGIKTSVRRTGDEAVADAGIKTSVRRTGDEDDDFGVAASGPKQEPAGEEKLPPRLGGYEVLKVLGKGGMGAVLLGRQISLNRKVALKVMHAQIAKNPNFVARFTREAYAAAQLTHHNVVQIYDIGEDKGQHFFSMEFVQGQSLMDLLLEQGRIGPEAAVGYVLQAARGLRYGHKQGMVHRDIKPANLLINDEGIVKVADLGLVKLSSGEAEPEGGLKGVGGNDAMLTGAGMAVGTPAFMAPEQATSSSTVDGRADIYSLGCTLYTLVTGRPPFEGRSAPEVMSKHLTEPVVPPEAIVKRVPGALSAILMRMLAKDPDERYQTMDEVIAVLEGFLGLSRSGTFTPTDRETDQLEGLATEYQEKSGGGRKMMVAIGFAIVCVAGLAAAAVTGRPVTAVKVFFLFGLAPPAYFLIHGLMTGGVVFARFRALVFGMRFFDWLMVLGGAALFLGILALFGLFVAWIKLTILAFLLGFYLWVLTDRVQEEAQRQSLRNGKLLCRALRSQGLSEEQLREFVCKYAGPHWEPFFEALFGYEAKLAARALRTGETTGPWKKHAAWREPIVAWADARLEARRRAREQRYLQRIEAKALEAKGVNKSEAEERAAAMAAALVDEAAEADKARKAGKEVDLRGMVKSARSGKPKPGFNADGKRLRDRWLRDLLNDWFGRRLRFLTGALLLAAGVFWMHQNILLHEKNPVVQQVQSGQVMLAVTTLSEPAGKPLSVPVVPSKLTSVVDSYRVPIAGFCLLVSAVFFFGWRSSVPCMAGAVFMVAGPALGVPDTGVMSPAMLSLLAGMILILPVGWLLRK